jgi:hypothetical protein
MAAVIASLTLSSIPADACSCRPPPSPAAARDAADAVFEGRAGTGTVAKSAGPGLSPTGMSVPFTVIRGFKGVNAGEQVTIATSGSPAMCGFPFAAGETYLVYAWREKSGGFGTGLCSRTRKSADATDDFAAFAAPAGGGSPAPSPGGATSSTAPAATAKDPATAGNSNATPGNTTGPGSSEPAPAGAPSGISVEPASAAPPAETPSGGCAACAVNPGDQNEQMPELAALLGLAAVAGRIARRRR